MRLMNPAQSPRWLSSYVAGQRETVPSIISSPDSRLRTENAIGAYRTSRWLQRTAIVDSRDPSRIRSVVEVSEPRSTLNVNRQR